MSKPRQKCPHGRQRSRCKSCGGTGFCKHGRQKSMCRDCGGTSVCEHNRLRSKCKTCGGSAFCKHGRSRCKSCGGTGFCKHGQSRPAPASANTASQDHSECVMVVAEELAEKVTHVQMEHKAGAAGRDMAAENAPPMHAPSRTPLLLPLLLSHNLPTPRVR